MAPGPAAAPGSGPAAAPPPRPTESSHDERSTPDGETTTSLREVISFYEDLPTPRRGPADQQWTLQAA